MLPVGVNVPGVCARALDARRNERKIEFAITDALILWEFNIMSPLAPHTPHPPGNTTFSPPGPPFRGPGVGGEKLFSTTEAAEEYTNNLWSNNPQRKLYLPIL